MGAIETSSDGQARVEQLRAERLERLAYLAYNVRWSWELRAAQLFADLAPETWRSSHNAVAVVGDLGRTDGTRLMANSAAIDKACSELEEYLQLETFNPFAGLPRIAYLSAEFAVANCLPMYAGGLGVLAGDHLKAASDLGVPIVGVGLLYRHGYFRQRIDEWGQQRERYDSLDTTRLPLRLVLVGDRLPLRITVPFPGRHVYAHVWRADVGRAPLYLLDTDVPDNREDDRWITAHLYGGDQDTRLRQEMVLGIGGARLLRALATAGIEAAVAVYHLNEGHSAFVVLELARECLELGAAGRFDEALLQAAQRVAFTTHTAVSAGHDAYPPNLMEAYMAAYRRELGLSHEAFMRLGQRHPLIDGSEPFSMTVLALRGASWRNGVSRLHTQVSRQIWTGVGVGLHDRRPAVFMANIANGVHGPTWVGPEMAALYDEYLGRAWRYAARHPATWLGLESVSPSRLWQARTDQRKRLLSRAGIDLPPERALVIGFARRFATYKRAGLLLEDPQRLANLLTGDPDRPVTLVFAGKAHPRDEPGKRLVQRVVEATRDERFRGRLVFLADYEIDVARLLVQGTDVWLNTPRRPSEASGTSGMKAAMNGGLNLSELDGWWDEAFQPKLGWAIGADLPEDLSDEDRDRTEARQLVELLELQVTPSFYARDTSGLPLDWLACVVRSIVTLAPYYSAERMVTDYAVRFYWPAASGGKQRSTSDMTVPPSRGFGTQPAAATG